jgi:membrane-bound inhibitor of C-type lysozyme
MKKFIFLALAIVLLSPSASQASVAGDFWQKFSTWPKNFVALFKPAGVTAPFNSVVFKCDGGKTIAAKVEVRPKALGRVKLKLSDRTKTLVLDQTRSGSGARYANKNETFVFWNKGDTAFITENGSTTFADCVLSGAAKKNDSVVCIQDAKQCPDGSYVGRTGPKCEFTECPLYLGKLVISDIKVGQKYGGLTVVSVGPFLNNNSIPFSSDNYKVVLIGVEKIKGSYEIREYWGDILFVFIPDKGTFLEGYPFVPDNYSIVEDFVKENKGGKAEITLDKLTLQKAPTDVMSIARIISIKKISEIPKDE